MGAVIREERFFVFIAVASLVDTRSVDFFRMHAYAFLIETKKKPDRSQAIKRV